MPKAWSRKQERQYEHIKDSARGRGASSKRAKEMAARTVNKGRRMRGETMNRTTQGTGNPNTDLQGRSVGELKNIAADMNIEGRSKMKKAQLVKAIQRKR
jgi:hypothetical protein